MRSHHDMGGQPAGPVDTAEHHNALWEKRVDALLSGFGSHQDEARPARREAVDDIFRV